MIAMTALIVLPPIVFLVEASLTVGEGPDSAIGLDHYRYVFDLSGARLWSVSLIYAAGSSCFAIVIGASSAWLVARTNAYFRQVAVVGAYLSLAAPVMVKAIGWILLLGPNKGVINEWLRALLGSDGVPIELFTLTGMTLLEGLLWVPIVFLLTMPALSAMDPALEEAAAMAGATAAAGAVACDAASGVAGNSGGVPADLHPGDRVIRDSVPDRHAGQPADLYHGDLPHHSSRLPAALWRGQRLFGSARGWWSRCRSSDITASPGMRSATRPSPAKASARAPGSRRLARAGWAYLLVMPLTLVAPLLILLWASFLPIYEPPSAADLGRVTLANYTEVLTRPTTVAGLWNGIVVASLSSTAVTGFTFLLAWLVIRRREPERWLLDMLASLPLVLPGIVLGTAVLNRVSAGSGRADLRHDLDHGLRLLGPLHALRHALLLRRHRLGASPSRGMRAHLWGRSPHHAVAHRAAVGDAGDRGGLDLRVPVVDPRPLPAGHAGRAEQPPDRGGDPRPVGTKARFRRSARSASCWR